MYNDQNSITEGVVWRSMLKFFFPILLGTFFQMMYNTADAIIVGKFVGTQGLAAVGGGTSSLINLIVGFFIGLSGGATVILSQHYGARNHQAVQETVHTAAALSLTGGTLLTVIGLVMSPLMLQWMGCPADVIDSAALYTRVYFCGMIPNIIYNIGSGLLRAVGDSRRPLLFLIVACMTNIVLDVLLVAGLNMGVAGAALATILSQAVSAVLVALALMHAGSSYRLDPRKIRFHRLQLIQIVRIGLPAGLQSVMYSFSNVIIQAGINSFGTIFIASNTAFQKLDGLFWMIVNAFGATITTFVGQNFGAGNLKRMKKCIRVGALMTIGGTIFVTSTLLIFGKTLVSMFTTDPAVVDCGLVILHTISPFYFTYIGIEICSSSLRGCGDVLVPMLITLLGICTLRMLWVVFILPTNHTIQTLLTCYPVSWSTASVLFLLYYFCSGWLPRRLRKIGREDLPAQR